MQLCRVQAADGRVRVGVLADEHVQTLDLDGSTAIQTLSDILHADRPATVAQGLLDTSARPVPLKDLTILPPVDQQEIWAAGVTYKRSQEARERESVGAARFYDLVYSAARPELFFKATAARAVGPGARVHIRRDSRWSVPEPELAVVVSPQMQIVGYTIGNDMSARDIEGENPLYLPQAKIYTNSCALGPVITLADSMPQPSDVRIHLLIERRGQRVFEGQTSLTAMNRSLEDLVQWLGRENMFPHGVILLTGTGIVPPDDFTLVVGDLVTIEVTGIGKLVNLVDQS